MTDQTERDRSAFGGVSRWPKVQGRCPACGRDSLFLGSGGYVTCSIIGCSKPDAATDVLSRIPAPHVESNGPEHGHTFEVSVRSRGASTVIGSGIYSDANWWGDPLVMRVRAWNLADALAMASQIPFGEWKWPSEDGPAPTAARCSHGCDTSVGPTALCIVDGHTTASAPTDREALVEKVAKAVKPLFDQAGLVDLDAEDYGWDAARAALDAIEEVRRG